MGHENHPRASDPQELAQLLVAAANAGDVEGMVALYEPEAVLAGGGGKTARGTVEIREFYTALLKTGIVFTLGTQRPPLVSGEIALTSTRLPNGIITAEVARRQEDGSWRWVIDQPSISG